MELGSAAKAGPYVATENSGEAEMTMLKSFLRDEKGATAIEYGLIAAGISVAIITVVQGLGSSLNTTFGSVKNALN
jgi:pilus assembly protein Flp/PilA